MTTAAEAETAEIVIVSVPRPVKDLEIVNLEAAAVVAERVSLYVIVKDVPEEATAEDE